MPHQFHDGPHCFGSFHHRAPSSSFAVGSPGASTNASPDSSLSVPIRPQSPSSPSATSASIESRCLQPSEPSDFGRKPPAWQPQRSRPQTTTSIGSWGPSPTYFSSRNVLPISPGSGTSSNTR